MSETKGSAQDHDLDFMIGDNAAETLKQYASTIAEHELEIERIRQFMKEARAEAKANGFDTKALNCVVKATVAELRGDSQEPRVLSEGLNRTYLKAAGFLVAE